MRKAAGKETWHTLRDWDRGQTAAERLVAQIVLVEGFQSVDPSHPLGGPDGLKDLICQKNKTTYVVAGYFPRGQQALSDIKKKFLGDSIGVEKNKAQGFVFVTNQELSLGERTDLFDSCQNIDMMEIYHLERIASILNSPACYGIRLDFLDIEMSKEEQLAFIALRDSQLKQLFEEQKSLAHRIERVISGLINPSEHEFAVLKEIREFQQILNQIAGEGSFAYSFLGGGHVGKLSVPLADLREFKRILDLVTGDGYLSVLNSGTVGNLKVPLQEIRQFEEILNRITSHSNYLATTALTIWNSDKQNGKIGDLRVPLENLNEYENTLDRILRKLKKKNDLEN